MNLRYPEAGIGGRSGIYPHSVGSCDNGVYPHSVGSSGLRALQPLRASSKRLFVQGVMFWCSSKPRSAVPTFWGYFPLAARKPFAAGAAHLSTPRTSPQSKLGTRGMMNPVDVRGGSPGRLIRLERHKSFAMHSYEKRACKSFAIHSYGIVGLKVPWNHILTKKGRWGSARFATSLLPPMPIARFPGLVPRVPCRTFLPPVPSQLHAPMHDTYVLENRGKPTAASRGRSEPERANPAHEGE